MKRFATCLCGLTFVSVSGAGTLDDVFLKNVLDRRFLPNNAEETSFTSVFGEVEAADVAADEAWSALKGKGEYDACRRSMHARYVTAVGGFPEKTPLNAKVVETVPRQGYRVDKVLFESQPGIYVTALVYLPDPAKFAPPYPAFCVSCGHSILGKGCPDYGRVCVIAALQGFAALIYDPIEQGERLQDQDPPTPNTRGHNRFGVLAMLLGKSTARQRLWDGMRCIDYLDTRADVRHDGYGFMGNSGGGTMTALIMAMDPRVKAAAPACYLTSLRHLNLAMGPQDAEQNVFGQLAFGLNHAGYVLMGDNAVRMHCCHNDMFPFAGSSETYRAVQRAVAACGLDAERYGLTDVPGPHGWKESMRTSSVLWMRRWLMDDRNALPIDVVRCRELDVGFDIKAVDHGLGEKGHHVAYQGQVRNLPGFRSVYEYLKDDLAAAEKARKTLSGAALAARVRARAGIRHRNEIHVTVKEVSRATTNGHEVVRLAFSFPNGLRIPSVMIRPQIAAKGAALLVGDGMRGDRAAQARSWLEKGMTVLVADLVGTGEIGGLRHSFYGVKTEDEELAVMYYWLGKSLVGVRAEEIVVLADWLGSTAGQAPTLVAAGSTAIAGAHAYAADRSLFASVSVDSAPLGWAQAVRESAIYRFANAVQGALLDYDWIDLVK